MSTRINETLSVIVKMTAFVLYWTLVVIISYRFRSHLSFTATHETSGPVCHMETRVHTVLPVSRFGLLNVLDLEGSFCTLLE